MLEKVETSAEWMTITCDVPRCRERIDLVHSTEAYREGHARWVSARDEGWEDITLTTSDGRTDKHLHLCPKHVPLAEHRDLINLLYAAIVQPDPDRLPLEI